MLLFRWISQSYRFSANGIKAGIDAISYYGSVGVVLKKAVRILRTEGTGSVLQRAKIMMHVVSSRGGISNQSTTSDLYGNAGKRNSTFYPKVSVIVPNYNHAQYLRKRLDSIYSQTYRNIEVILLDDFSTDESMLILQEYQKKYAASTKLVANDENSGGVFNQWRRGFTLASGELVWIAESDDYCDSNFLENLVGFFENSAVMLSFCRSDFVDSESEKTCWTTEEALSDLGTELWRKTFIRSAHWLVNYGWGVKNIIPNVSSAVIRNPKNLPLLDDNSWKNLRLCGDWIFYLNLVRGGLVAYSPHVTNYYRQHSQNTSILAHRTDTYYSEHEIVARWILSLYKIEKNILILHEKSLYIHWCTWRGFDNDVDFEKLFNISRITETAQVRQPNLMMFTYSLVAGGGETFPIILANELKRNGWPVTFFNCNVIKTVAGVREMLDPNIPLLEIDGIQHIGGICDDMGIELMHSHHAWVDITISECIRGANKPKHVVSFHGMYELIEADRLPYIENILLKQVDAIVYTAEKNIKPFSRDFLEIKNPSRINNALNFQRFSAARREDLGIMMTDFVLCLVSRAVPEKGWEEAILSVCQANITSSRKIHLVLIGEGPEYIRLSNKKIQFIHFLGYKPNIRDYFAMADFGFLPSRFIGESFPLVLIDCLLAGTPILASNVGEIMAMLSTEAGIAGEIFNLVDGQIPINFVSELISKIANDEAGYATMVASVQEAASKFDITIMREKYESIYRDLVQ